jgi:hypothetical protein
MSNPAQQATSKPKDEYRLATNVLPTHYDLTIQTDLEALVFKGFVIVEYVLLAAASIDSLKAFYMKP